MSYLMILSFWASDSLLFNRFLMSLSLELGELSLGSGFFSFGLRAELSRLIRGEAIPLGDKVLWNFFFRFGLVNNLGEFTRFTAVNSTCCCLFP